VLTLYNFMGVVGQDGRSAHESSSGKGILLIFVSVDLFCRYITVNVIVPSCVLFCQSYKMKSIAEGVLEKLQEKELSTHPIIFHIFSNGGCMVYTQVRYM
jgi:hypothetical protein